MTLISYLIYLAIGFIGLPVFSGFTGGIGKVAGPTGGYMIGFLFMIPLPGDFAKIVIASIAGPVVAKAVKRAV